MVWQGMLALKNDQSYVQMHFVSGSKDLPDQALPQVVFSGQALPLRISQRMRLEPPNLEGVTKRMIVSVESLLSLLFSVSPFPLPPLLLPPIVFFLPSPVSQLLTVCLSPTHYTFFLIVLHPPTLFFLSLLPPLFNLFQMVRTDYFGQNGRVTGYY